ncbi:MAG: CHAT domain-containing tetratricopeptide repeat protein [Paracoccaceae bacterium]
MSLDSAYEAYDAGENERALALAEAALDADIPPFEAISARELIAWIQFDEGRSGQAYLDELIALDSDIASFYGLDALERLNVLGFMASVSYDLGSEESLLYEVQIARIARLHPDTSEVHLLSLRNIAVEISNGDDAELALQFSALYENFAATYLPGDHPNVMEARAMLSLALTQTGDVLRGLKVASVYDEKAWESFAQIGPEEAELFAEIHSNADAAFADTSVDWPTRIRGAVERSTRLAELNSEIILANESGGIESALPLLEQYLQLAGREDTSVAHYSAVLMQAYLEDGQYAQARPYLTNLLSLPSLYLVAIDLPAGPVALTAARNGGVEDVLLDALLAKGLDVEHILRDPDPTNRIDLMTVVGQTKARMGDHDASLSAYENALQALETTGHDDPVTRNNALFGAGVALVNMGRDDDAIAHFKRLTEIADGTHHFDALSASLTQLALIELRQERPAQSIIYARRKLELEEARTAPVPSDIATSKTVLAMALFTQTPHLTAELSQVLSSMFDANVSDPILSASRKQLFSLVANRTEMSAQDLTHDATFSNLAKALQAEILTVLADLAFDAENYDAASAYMLFGLEIAASTSPEFGKLKLIEGRLAQNDGRTNDALLAFRAVTDLRIPRGERVDQQNIIHLPFHLAAAYDLATDPIAGQDLRFHNELFQLAQLASTTVAGGALNDAIARSQTSGRLADLLRERQTLSRDLVSLRDAISRAQYDGRSPDAILTQVQQKEERQKAITAEIAKESPDLASVWDFNPLRMEAVAKSLRDDEALIVFATSDAPVAGDHTGSYAIAMSKESVIVSLIPPRADLVALSHTLRCSAALTDPSCATSGGDGTRGGFSLEPEENPDASAGPAFDTQAAHDAYLDLFADLSDLTADKKRLVIVADQALISMPFHLALKAPLAAERPMREGQWLIRDHSIEVIPSVSSFVAMRDTHIAKREKNAPSRPVRFLGIGDPLIGIQRDGPVDFQCGHTTVPVLTASLDTNLVNRGLGSVRTDALRDLAALPDTRCELHRLASHFGDDSTVILNDAATETKVKDLSASGDLRDYSVISFATHGLIAGEIGINDSGLVLSPPELPTALDDGLLTTQEIAALQLDADFVILSACNTASGDSQNQEGLSGMASAFFYAGARSLMVSHWPVYSDAAVDLTTRSFEAMQSDPTMTRADAIRSAMLSILDDPFATPRQSHPSYWAPFVIVGDGLGIQN